MKTIKVARCALVLCLFASSVLATDTPELRERRQRAAKLFSDGVLLLHARTITDAVADSFRENPAFYYLTGQENSSGAVFALDGNTGESWLFLPKPPGTPDTDSDSAAAQHRAADHLVNWSELDAFLTRQATGSAKIYYERGDPELPDNVSASKDPRVSAWVLLLQKKWPALQFEPVGKRLNTLMAVESPVEQKLSREAAGATVSAFYAGIKAIHPNLTQRSVELIVADACWRAGVHGVSFWPWVMAGPNGVFPKPFESDSRYDHLDAIMHPGDLVRFDIGCESQHYQGDLGRTVPVSGRYSDEQREIWNAFVDAYRAGMKLLHAGTTEDQVFDAWSKELARHRDAVKSALAKQAIDTWTDRKNLPYWQLHTMNTDAGYIEGPLRSGMVIDFEPIVSIGGQGYYMEDMFLIQNEAAEDLTPGVPFTAEEIEAAMLAKP